jgi:hypothetical protein
MYLALTTDRGIAIVAAESCGPNQRLVPTPADYLTPYGFEVVGRGGRIEFTARDPSYPPCGRCARTPARTRRRARRVVEQGVPELVEAMDQGVVSVAAAAEVAPLPPEEQREAVAGGPEAVRERAREAQAQRKPRAGPRPSCKASEPEADAPATAGTTVEALEAGWQGANPATRDEFCRRQRRGLLLWLKMDQPADQSAERTASKVYVINRREQPATLRTVTVTGRRSAEAEEEGEGEGTTSEKPNPSLAATFTLSAEALRPLIAEVEAEVRAQEEADRARFPEAWLCDSEPEAAALLGVEPHVL